ncbi:MAG: glycosyltransferase [Treponemataceae bacterium]
MKSELISVIIPVYNAENYIRECLESIINQTYKNLEIILVDDGSTDNSGKICDEYAQKDSRIKVIHKENVGQQKARMSGIKIATGDYVSFIDSDDYIELNTYQTFYKQFCAGYDVICFGMNLVDQNRNFISLRTDKLPEKLYESQEDIAFVLKNFISCDKNDYTSYGILNSLATKVIKKTIIDKIIEKDIYYIRIGEDFQFTLLALLQCKSIFITHTPFYNYRQNSDSVTHNLHENYLTELNELYKFFIKETKDCPYKDEMKEKFVQRFMHDVINLTPTFLGFDYSQEFYKYIFPDFNKIENKRIVIYGAGKVGKCYYRYIPKLSDSKIVLWIDKYVDKAKNDLVEPIEKVKTQEYDYIIVAVLRSEIAEEITAELKQLGIPQEKILWKKPVLL